MWPRWGRPLMNSSGLADVELRRTRNLLRYSYEPVSIHIVSVFPFQHELLAEKKGVEPLR